MDLRLAGKTALITGGSKGIGRATAEILAGEGCNVILVSRSAENLDAPNPPSCKKPMCGSIRWRSTWRTAGMCSVSPRIFLPSTSW